MDQDRVDIPRSFWERLVADKRRLALVGSGALAVLLLLAWALFAGPLAHPRDDWGDTGPVALDPIDDGTETSGTPTPDGTEETSRTTDAAADESDDAAQESEEPQFVRAALVAYRLDGALWVSAEDGSGARTVTSNPLGGFALSPNGETLAWVDSQSHLLHLAEVSTAKDRIVGPAEDVRPCWAPDSSRVAYTGVVGAQLQARTVKANGAEDHLIGVGHSATIAQDGTVAFIASPALGAMGPIAVTDVRGKPVELGVSANAVAFGGDGLVWATSGSGAGSERIMTSRLDGGASRELIAGASLSKPVMYAMLCVSPAGDALLFGAIGDDGFSRTFVTSLAKPSPVQLTVRRDTYPHAWSADGSRIFFFEGNTFQGEMSSLLRADTAGFGRVVVVQGAGF